MGRTLATPRRLQDQRDPEEAMNSVGRIAIGIRLLRGRAVAIAICGDRATPAYVGRAELLLSDPKFPSTLRPFHAIARLRLEKALPMVQRDETLVRKAATTSMSSFIERLRKSKMSPRHAAIVSDDEPAQIGNPHLKAHAEERRLFREATASAARDLGIDSIFLVETEISESAFKIIGVTRPTIHLWLEDIAAVAGRPWRAVEKTSAVAAWIALASGQRSGVESQ